MDAKNKVTLKIPRPLYNRLKVIIEDTGFNSVTDFVVWVLRDLVSLPHRENANQDNTLQPEEIEGIRTRLKNLGYL